MAKGTLGRNEYKLHFDYGKYGEVSFQVDADRTVVL